MIGYKLLYKNKNGRHKKAQVLSRTLLGSTGPQNHNITAQFAKIRQNEFWRSYDFSKKNLLHVPENQKAEINFLTTRKNFLDGFFFLISVKTFK